MKKICAIAAAGLLMWSCGNSEKQIKTFQDVEREFAATLTASDTTQVLELGTALLDDLKAGNVTAALESLCSIDSTGMVVPVDEPTRQRLRARFKAFPVADYELDYYGFSLPLLNDLKYRTYFKMRAEGETSGPAMSLMLNPVKVDGEWYLCVKEAGQPAKDAATAINPDAIIEQQ